MKRTDFYNTTIVDGKVEYDYLNSTINKFVTNYPVSYYRISQQDLMRPDAISYKMYGTEEYWWIICMLNDINDVFHDMNVGDLIKLPSISDIYTFYKQNSIR